MSNHDKRQRILSAATTVFAERDFHRVLVSEVASRAGVGKGTVYLYFPTKDDLHRAALEGSLERLAAEVERAAEADAPVEALLRDIVLSILRFFWRRHHLLTLVQRYERRTTPDWYPSGPMVGGSITHRVEWTSQWATAARRVRGASRTMPARCWPLPSAGRWTSGCAIGSWPRQAAIRWRCSSCRAD